MSVVTVMDRSSTSGNYHARPAVGTRSARCRLSIHPREMVIELHADTTSPGLDGVAAGNPGSPLSETEAERLIGAICFKTGPPGTIGAELEWLVSDAANPLLTVP